MTSKELFDKNKSIGSDIGAHMETMLNLGSKCKSIVEFGVRGGNSTSAWLHASPKALFCYDIAEPQLIGTFNEIAEKNKILFRFERANTSKLGDIPETDLLFLDTLHTYGQLKSELKHHGRVNKYIVMHDTETNKTKGENGEEGLQKAIDEFLAENKEWKVEAHYPECNGLTVLCRIKGLTLSLPV